MSSVGNISIADIQWLNIEELFNIRSIGTNHGVNDSNESCVKEFNAVLSFVFPRNVFLAKYRGQGIIINPQSLKGMFRKLVPPFP